MGLSRWRGSTRRRRRTAQGWCPGSLSGSTPCPSTPSRRMYSPTCPQMGCWSSRPPNLILHSHMISRSTRSNPSAQFSNYLYFMLHYHPRRILQHYVNQPIKINQVYVSSSKKISNIISTNKNLPKLYQPVIP